MKNARSTTFLTLPLVAALLAGCGSTAVSISDPPVAPTPSPVTGYAGMGFSGKVLAGSAPVAGASMQLYAAGSAGNRIAGASLLASALVTDANGNFTVPAMYRCPLPGTQVYLVARGGSVAGNANGALALMSAVGTCNQIAATDVFTVNEVTTVAAVWTLAQFLGPGGAVGTTPTNTAGLATAFRLAAGLASPSSGTSPGGLTGNVTSPASRINTLANLLNTCTSGGGSAAPGSCDRLFAAVTVSGLPIPQDTLDAAMLVTQHPATNVAALYAVAHGSSAFSPTLAAVPADWTVFLTISGGGMNAPATLGVLSTGNVWVANYFGAASSFTPLGAPVFASGINGSGLDHSYGLAVDAADNAWITNEDKSTVTELASSGMALSGTTGYTAAGINFPVAVAIDPDNTVWVVDYGNAHLSRLSQSGTSLSGAKGYASDQIAFPVAIAVDGSHRAWIANSEGTTITRVSQDGTQVASVSCCNGPDGLAIDQRGYVWVSNFFSNTISEVSSDLKIVSSGYGDGSLTRPQGIAVDGSGDVWVSSFRGVGVVELAGSQTSTPGAVLSPAGGWAHDAPLVGAYSLAIDASGNLWISNFGNSTLTEIVGLAAPVKTPSIGPAQAP